MAADPTKLKVAKDVSRKEILFGLGRVPNTERVFFGASDGSLYATDLSAEKPEFKQASGHEGFVLGVAVAGAIVVSGAYDGRLIFWEADSLTKIRTVEQAHKKWIRKLCASPDGKLVASVADDMVCRVWNAASGELVHALEGHAVETPTHYPSMLFGCNFSADGTLLATCDKVGHAIVWDVATGKQVGAVDAPKMYTWDPRARRHSIGGARSVAFSPDAKLLAIGGTGQIGNVDHLEAPARVEVFDWKKAEQTHEFPGDRFKGLVEQLAFSPDGKLLIAAGGAHDGFVTFFDLDAKKTLHADKAPAHIHSFSLAESGDRLYAAAHGRALVMSFIASEEPAKTEPEPAKKA